MLALGIYVDDEPTAPQLAAVRRAVRNLARRDLVHVNRIYRRTTTKIYHNQGAYPDWSYEAPIGELEVHWGSAFDAFETER